VVARIASLRYAPLLHIGLIAGVGNIAWLRPPLAPELTMLPPLKARNFDHLLTALTSQIKGEMNTPNFKQFTPLTGQGEESDAHCFDACSRDIDVSRWRRLG
jgi:hypothetical protein